MAGAVGGDARQPDALHRARGARRRYQFRHHQVTASRERHEAAGLGHTARRGPPPGSSSASRARRARARESLGLAAMGGAGRSAHERRERGRQAEEGGGARRSPAWRRGGLRSTANDPARRLGDGQADASSATRSACGGDASSQKCMDVFRQDAARVTGPRHHDMTGVCDRAVIHDGELHRRRRGGALRYYRLNFGGDRTKGRARAASRTSTCASSTRGCENDAGERVENVEQGEPIGLDVVFEARHDLEDPVFGFHFLNANGETVFGFNRTLTVPDGEPEPDRRGPARADRGHDREPARCPGATSSTAGSRATATQGDLALHVRAAARLRRLRHAARARERVGRRRRRGRPGAERAPRHERRLPRAARRPRPVRARRRLAARARPALPDRGRPSSSARTSAPRSATCGRSRAR